MTERDALLAAILSSPRDDTPRMIYADWLEDRGEVERAEFIRITIERGLKASAEVFDNPLRWTVHGRNGSPVLADALEADLWRAMPNTPIGTSVVYRRGFISTLTLSWSDFLRHHAALVWSPRQTVECPKCEGSGEYSESGSEADAGHCPQCYNFEKRTFPRGTGRIPRPFVSTVQPLETVRLTTWSGNRFSINSIQLTDSDGDLVGQTMTRVACSRCGGEAPRSPDGRRSKCLWCNGLPLNLWWCDTWPHVDFMMPG